MKRLLTVGIAVLMVTSCATPRVEQSIGTDGNEVFTLHCDGIRYIWNDCYDQAERLCPEGYQVIEELAERRTGRVFFGAVIPDRVQELVIECMGQPT